MTSLSEISKLKKQIKKLQPYKDKYYECSNKLDKILEDNKRKLESKRYLELYVECKYNEDTAYFKSKKQAYEFIKLLSCYMFTYCLIWEGKGRYKRSNILNGYSYFTKVNKKKEP